MNTDKMIKDFSYEESKKKPVEELSMFELILQIKELSDQIKKRDKNEKSHS